jgi:hypothetical protein
MSDRILTVHFLDSGSCEVSFSAIDGISPGILDSAFMQARHELKRLCNVEKAAVEKAEETEVLEEAPAEEALDEVAEETEAMEPPEPPTEA